MYCVYVCVYVCVCVYMCMCVYIYIYIYLYFLFLFLLSVFSHIYSFTFPFPYFLFFFCHISIIYFDFFLSPRFVFHSAFAIYFPAFLPCLFFITHSFFPCSVSLFLLLSLRTLYFAFVHSALIFPYVLFYFFLSLPFLYLHLSQDRDSWRHL